MATSFAIAVGNSNSYVASCQKGGVEILLNEYSSRSTPTFVAFNNEHRSMGNDAASNLLLNPKNTIFDLMVLVGKTYDQIDCSNYPFQIEKGPNDQPLVVVQYLGEERKFTITQVLAMLFTKLRSIAGGAPECVISCPQYFDNDRKDAVLQAAFIAGLKPMQLITEMAAIILNYAYYRTTREDTHKFIAFVNLGQSNLQTAVAWFNPKDDEVKILAANSEPIGGQDFDKCLAKHFIDGHNLKLTPKQYLKLVSACEKLKRLLSANANDIPLNVESLISEDKDFTARINRATFEELIQPLLQKVKDCITRTLEDAKVSFNKVIEEATEAAKAAQVARAAESAKVVELQKKAEALTAAKAVIEAKVAEEKAAAEKAKKTEAKNDTQNVDDDKMNGDGIPGDQPQPDDNQQPPNNNPDNKEVPMDVESAELSKITAEEAKAVHAVKVAKSTERSFVSQANRLCKLAEVKFDLQVVEMVGGSTRIPAFKQLIQEAFSLTPSTTLNTDEAVARGCVIHCATLHPGLKVKREVKIMGNSGDLVTPTKFTCDEELRRTELKMIASDRDYRARTEARNTLEEFIYAERSKLKEGDKFLQDLSDALDWLFSDEGEEASGDTYVAKLSDLKKLSEANRTDDQQSSDVKE